ncbi:beta-galactosidase [Bifidobacterium lemurum]|uniref:beta-galactosidase n=1 Tax=Bifidobacterium lemurum TaxID=1603886 RepID=A0A261FS09_9BIFI|nr:beta-galactosidase [Bifidobacterium lemurum]OZG61971.1 beta-galactosidase [Bifidobacterium lemurum]QOL35251.1 beta-galactosidase [Bifidobacterium lemurum]
MTQQDDILFGAAYYDEYMPYDRLDQDVAMLKAAHMNTVRIAESTWSTLEPRPGEFDFTHIDRVLDAMERAGINVIVGTPTYAVPSWLTARHPEILVRQHAGLRRYGPRQVMDIVNEDFRKAAERVIRALIGHVCQRGAVIGYQIDNETKYYDALNDDIQQAFVRHLRDRFDDDLDALNAAFGLDYWSNRIDDWECFPDLSETINGSLAGAFDRFRRSCVAEYLAWQASIVREYAREDQFVTQNHDLEWRGYSYGVQPWADHFANAEALDCTSVDIYHPTESRLTGKEIAFGGDLTRSTKNGRNYLVMETQAQGQPGWMPFPGQLRLQAYSHLASGSNSVMYWHWHSIHNSFETLWKGVLSHDFEPNPVYREAAVFGGEIERIGGHLVNLSKRNRVAIIVSNDSLSALNRFTIETGFPKPAPYEEGDSSGLVAYNDVLRWLYDALFELNVEVDILPPDVESERLSSYGLVIAPALYCVSERLIASLKEYVGQGGHLLSTFKSFFANEDVTVWCDRQPHGLAEVFGIRVGEFTIHSDDAALSFEGSLSGLEGAPSTIMELVEPAQGTQVLARYGHPAWRGYAAVTRNAYRDGWAQWVATMTDAETTRGIMREALTAAGIAQESDALAGTITVRRGVNALGRTITYLLNYSPNEVAFASPYEGVDLLSDEDASAQAVRVGDRISVAPWGVRILESMESDV